MKEVKYELFLLEMLIRKKDLEIFSMLKNDDKLFHHGIKRICIMLLIWWSSLNTKEQACIWYVWENKAKQLYQQDTLHVLFIG